MPAEIQVPPFRRSHRLKQGVVVALACATCALTGLLDAGAIIKWGLSHTRAVPAKASLRGERAVEMRMLKSAEAVIDHAYPKASPTPTAAAAALGASHRFSNVGTVSNNEDGLQKPKNSLLVNTSGVNPVLVVPGGGWQAMEAYERSPGNYVYKAREDAQTWTVLLLILSIVGSVGAIAWQLSLLEELLGKLNNRSRRLDAWKQLAISPAIAPTEPEDGFEILHPEKDPVETQDGTGVEFVVRGYRFSSTDGRWVPTNASIYGEHRRVWTPDDELTEMVAAWSEFCGMVTARNAERWASVQSERERKQAREQVLSPQSLRELLPPVAQVIDVDAYARQHEPTV